MWKTELLQHLGELGWKDPPELVGALAPDASGAGSSHTADDTLEAIEAELRACEGCELALRRRHVVPGAGDPHARVMFIGEAPGADEDRQGKPFVGQAGRLLDGMIRAMGLQRSRVYITNVVKCRPPGNRDPKPEEIAACARFLERQISLIEPEVIVALGRFAARWLTGTEKSMGALRGRWATFRNIPLLPIFHPAYLLRNPAGKARTWEDLKKIIARLEKNTASSREDGMTIDDKSAG